MYDKDRRSLASRFFRYTTQSKIIRKAPLLMCLGWAIAFAAGTTPGAIDDTSVHLAFVGTLFGGALAFMAMFAGVSKWVAEPAARKVLEEHRKEGIYAHPEYVPRSEWDNKHITLETHLSRVDQEISLLRAVNTGRDMEPR